MIKVEENNNTVFRDIVEDGYTLPLYDNILRWKLFGITIYKSHKKGSIDSEEKFKGKSQAIGF